MRWLAVGLTLLGIVVAAPAAAQERKEDDAFARALFDPQLVLKHAREIGLSAEQRRAIMDAIKATQTELVPLQLEMTEPSLELIELLEQRRIDEAAAVAKADQVLRIENQVKRLQIALLVRIKNTLSVEQQERLAALRERARRGGGAGDARGDSPIQ